MAPDVVIGTVTDVEARRVLAVDLAPTGGPGEHLRLELRDEDRPRRPARSTITGTAPEDRDSAVEVWVRGPSGTSPRRPPSGGRRSRSTPERRPRVGTLRGWPIDARSEGPVGPGVEADARATRGAHRRGVPLGARARDAGRSASGPTARGCADWPLPRPDPSRSRPSPGACGTSSTCTARIGPRSGSTCRRRGPPIGLDDPHGAPTGTAAEAIALLERAHDRWDAHLALADDARLAEPIGPVGGPTTPTAREPPTSCTCSTSSSTTAPRSRCCATCGAGSDPWRRSTRRAGDPGRPIGARRRSTSPWLPTDLVDQAAAYGRWDLVVGMVERRRDGEHRGPYPAPRGGRRRRARGGEDAARPRCGSERHTIPSTTPRRGSGPSSSGTRTSVERTSRDVDA